MAACQAVFGTYELVEAIFAEVSPFTLGTVVNVCKTWRKIVLESKKVADITVVEPDSVTSIRSLDVRYTQERELSLHPSLDPRIEPFDWGEACGPHLKATIHYKTQLAELKQYEQDFVSTPPVRTVKVECFSLMGLPHVRRISKEDGVRLRDVGIVVFAELMRGCAKVEIGMSLEPEWYTSQRRFLREIHRTHDFVVESAGSGRGRSVISAPLALKQC